MPRSILRIVGSIALVTPLLVSAAAAQEAPAAGVVTLKFGWPDDARARVEMERFRVDSNGASSDTTWRLVHYDLRVEPLQSDLLVRRSIVLAYADSAAVAAAAAAEGEPFPEPAELEALLAGLLEHIVVTRSGEFVRAENLGTLVAMFDSIMQPLIADVIADGKGEADPRLPMIRALAQAASEEALAAVTEQEWRHLVGMWLALGPEWESGQVYTLETEEEVPFFPGVAFPISYEFQVTAGVPCMGEDSPRECVKMYMLSITDPDASRAAVAEFLAKLVDTGEAASPLVESVVVEHEVTVIAHPATLLPYLFEFVKYVEMEMSDEPGQPASLQTREDIRLHRFTWQH